MMKKWLTLPLLLILAACGTTAPTAPTTTSTNGIKQGMDGDWKTVGRIHEGNIDVAYDAASLKRMGNEVALRDRKIVRDMNKEAYRDTPNYKTAVSDWVFHCTNRTYRLAAVQMWDNKKNLLAHHEYAASQIRPMPVLRDTPTQTLLDIACGR